jgi:hypothetical protein
VLETTRVDIVFQYALAVAAQSDDYRQRDLGPIHLLKYAYLADLAYAERHAGTTFTGTNWQFHHFGPWSVAAFDRIGPSVTNAGASQRSFSSRYADDVVRYRLDSEEAELLARRLERELPFEVTGAISRAVHQHGTDTADLLRHVYATPPMLNARPGSVLDFGTAVTRALASTGEPTELDRKLSSKDKRARRSIIESARTEIQRRLHGQAAARAVPMPAPRYDEVFFEGTAQLDRLAGEHVTASTGELRFGESVWLSSQRRDPDIS